MLLPFTKMHGLGNDFVVLNAVQAPVDLSAGQIRLLADRRFGIGCDQLLMIEPATSARADFRYRIFNADGAEVEQCGNGVRCIGDYLRRQGLLESNTLTVETRSGLVTIYLQDDGEVRVDMGVPCFEPERIPLASKQRQIPCVLELDDSRVEVVALSMGNPHAILVVDDIELAPLATLAPQIQRHVLFPAGVNVGFMQLVDRDHILLRVYERGVGETLACGTGACAAVAAGVITGRLASEVAVDLRGGRLTVEWAGEGRSLWMTGPATTVYEGRIEI